MVADLVAANLIDQVRDIRPPEYVFYHPLIRAVAYEAQLKSHRAELHRRVAAAIESGVDRRGINTLSVLLSIADDEGDDPPPVTQVERRGRKPTLGAI